MARQKKVEQSWHQFRMGEKAGCLVGEREAVVNGTGRHIYLWVGPSDGNDVNRTIYTFSGRKTLRAMAFAILDATGGRDEKGNRNARK